MPAAITRPIAPVRSLVARDVFQFLDVQRECSTPSDWAPTDVSKLWRYNTALLRLPGSGRSRDAWRLACARRCCIAGSTRSRPARGDEWEPYPLSRRVVNWIKWTLGGGEPTADALASLAMQVRWLEQRLEFHHAGQPPAGEREGPGVRGSVLRRGGGGGGTAPARRCSRRSSTSRSSPTVRTSSSAPCITRRCSRTSSTW